MSRMQDRYRSLVSNLPDGLALLQVLLDDDGNPIDYVFLDVNPALEALTGLTRDQMVGKGVAEVLPEREHSGFDWAGTYGRVVLTGQSVTFEQYAEPVGRWYEVTACSDDPGTLITVFRDITSRRQAEQSLRETERRLRSLFEQSRDAIYIGTLDGKVIDVNQAWLDLFGYSREELPSINAIDFYIDPDERRNFVQRIELSGFIMDEVRFKRKDGAEFDCERSIVARRDQHGNVIVVQGVMRDVTQQKRDRAELERLARLDSLTGVLNRHTIVEKLGDWISHSRRYRARLSVVMLDLDHFKQVNDIHGHVAGDQVLANTASLLQRSVRRTDFVGRYGGDEFLVILPCTNSRGAAVAASRIRSTIERASPHAGEDGTLSVTVSLGVAEWHEGDTVDALLLRADDALYRAKHTGGNRVEVAVWPLQGEGPSS